MPTFATQAQAIAAGYRRARPNAAVNPDRDVSGPRSRGYIFEEAGSGRRTVTVWFTDERSCAPGNPRGCFAPMFPPE